MGTIQNHADTVLEETVFDISNSDGKFFFIDLAMAIDLFSPLEELKDSCTKLCFANHIFGVEAALVAKRALMGVRKTLRDVCLLHFSFGRSVHEGLQVMSIFSSALQRCRLRSLSLDLGNSGEKGVKAFAPLLKSQKTLEKLEFACGNVSREAARAICELLPSVETIKSLHFIYTSSGDDAADTISELVMKCIALEDFDFAGNDLSIRGAMALLKALGRGSGLKSLCLGDNMFGKAGGVALSKVISGHLGLTEVNLSYMDLEDKGVIAIARSLKDTAPSLKVLKVGGNYITRKAAPALAKCLAVKNLLTGFYAIDNELEDDGSVVICKAISEGHEQLKELDLSANAMTRIGAKAAAEAVANKPNFCRLSIKDNFISEKGIETVKDVLRKSIKGESVLSGELEQYEEEDLTDSDTESEEKLSHEDL